MHFDRRQMLKFGALLSASSVLPFGCSSLSPDEWIVSCCSDLQSNHFVAAINASGELVSKTLLPRRGHDVLALPHKPGRILVVARRPDRFLLEVDVVNGEITRRIESSPGSHFYGHAVVSNDNLAVFTSENDFENGRGIIVVRDPYTFAEINRFDSGGIGPHEFALMPDGKQIVVANGGIETHPDMPRIKLNLKTMQPNLSYLDIQTGKILQRVFPENNQLSLRHLTVVDDGRVFVGAQYEGSYQNNVPLVFRHHASSPLTPLRASSELWKKYRHYTASLINYDGILAVSGPKGNIVTIWDLQNEHLLSELFMKDVAGLTIQNGHLAYSGGTGHLVFNLVEPERVRVSSQKTYDDIRFDNHMAKIKVV